MAKIQQIEIPEECFICGETPVILHTDADQSEKQEHMSYWAGDGDKVTCPGCGAIGMISADDEIASCTWDETTDHNVECAKKYDASIPDKDHPNNPDSLEGERAAAVSEEQRHEQPVLGCDCHDCIR